MNTSCEIIKDLLPLYHDGVCSKESGIAVEEHLSHCESCKAEFNAIDEGLAVNTAEQNLKEAIAVKNLSKKWKKGMLMSLLKGVLITLLTVISFALILYLFIGIRIG
jgi:Predicted integral membrane protein